MTNEVLNPDIFAVYEAFAATEYGEKLAGNIRYEKYNLAHLSNEDWVRLLGADVNNLTHMPLTYGLANSFILETERVEPGTLDGTEQSLLKVAAIIHDQGEAIVGDISYGDKTEDDEANEKLQFAQNLEGFSPGTSIEMKELIAKARDEVVFDPITKLGRIFNAIERVGYLRTALRASGHVQAGTAGEAEPGLRWIVADVFGNQPVKLIEYAAEYPAVRNYLMNQKDLITSAFWLVESKDFENYGDTQDIKEAQFKDAWTIWQGWLQNNQF